MKKFKIYPKTAKLYVCGNAWGWEIDPDNRGMLEFYTSKNAALDDQSCTDTCGVVEIETRAIRWVQKPVLDPRARMSLARLKWMNAKQLARETVEAEVVTKLLDCAVTATLDEDMARAALTCALAKLNSKARAKRRRARERKARQR